MQVDGEKCVFSFDQHCNPSHLSITEPSQKGAKPMLDCNNAICLVFQSVHGCHMKAILGHRF